MPPSRTYHTFRTWETLSYDLRAQMRDLCIRDGGFRLWLSDYKYGHRDLLSGSYCISQDGVLLGWSLVARKADHVSSHIGVYVRAAYRRLGIGAKLLKRAARTCTTPELSGYPLGFACRMWDHLGIQALDPDDYDWGNELS